MRSDRLKQRREELDLSQAELGTRVGVDGNTIYRYEKTPMGVSSEILEKLAVALSVSSDWLLGVIDDQHSHLQEEGLKPIERKLLDAARRGDLAEMMKIALALTEENNKPDVPGSQPATNR